MATGLSRVRRRPASTKETLEQKLDRAESFYQRHLKAKLEKQYDGQAVAINPDTHQYVVVPDKVEGHRIAQRMFPGTILYLRGIGYVTRLGPRGPKRGR